ncbi:MAG TPA: hypothetical protein VIF62_05800 [Labilithrix sp.]|jgi:hypothetical protein
MKRALVFLLLAACSKDADPGSCYRARDNACAEYGRTEAAAGKRMCTGFEWRAGASSCPSENRIGLCNKDAHDDIVYSGPPNMFDVKAATTWCESLGGHFSSR